MEVDEGRMEVEDGESGEDGDYKQCEVFFKVKDPTGRPRKVQSIWLVHKRYSLIETLGSGGYGVVCSAKDHEGGTRVAIKRVTKSFERLLEAKRLLREIKMLQFFSHENITTLVDVMRPRSYEDFEDVYVVTELMQADMHWLVRSPQSLTPAHVKFFVYQILKGLKFIHSAGVIHRDIKPGNVLINKDCTVKICDFGLARGMITPTGDPPELTEYVVTRWYRAPEVLLQSHFYDGAVDIWSVGCIFVELFNRKPLFPGRDYIDQLNRVLNVMGTPSDEVLSRFASQQAIRWMKFQPFREPTPIESLVPSVDDTDAIDLLSRMLTLDPEARITAEDALRHPYFAALHDESAERTCPIKFDFSYEYPEITTEEIKRETWRTAQSFHPELEDPPKYQEF